MEPTKRLPYWLSGGSESCAICTHSYVLEMECRCVACDRGLCVECVVRLWPGGELFCPECHAQEAQG